MKLKVERSTFTEGLQSVQNIVGLRSTLPILSNVLLTAEKDKLWLTTTDLDVAVRCSIDAEISKTGAGTLPVRRLFSIIRELPENDIELDINDKHVSTIKCGSSFFKIIGLSEDEFPSFPKVEGKYSYNIDQGVFKEMLRKTSYAVSMDETRYVLTGILLSFKDGKLLTVATDGRRLSLVEYEMELLKEAESDFIIPAKAITELMHTLNDDGELKIYAGENQIIFAFNNVVIVSKLIDGTYPNYKQVIPAHCEERVTIERESLLNALKRASLLTTDKTGATKLTFTKNKVTILTDTPDVGEARETIPIKYSGKEISIAFNPEYMMDPLKNLSNDEIYIELTDNISPGVIKCDIPFLYVLMPMRVD